MSSDIGFLLAWLGERGADLGLRCKELAGPYVFESPIVTDRGADDWAVATDGRGVVWTLDWRPALIPTLWIKQKETREKLLMYLHPFRSALTRWQGRLAELREWAGSGVRGLPCEACKGTSAESEYVTCTFCDNDGWMCPEARPGFVCGISLDLNLLACLLQPFAADAWVKVIADQPRSVPQPLWIISPRFRIAVMGMSQTTDPADDLFAKWPSAPRFPFLATSGDAPR